jgi:hypothetical protein
MKSGYKSKIEINPETGKKCMIVFYDSKTDDFDEAINQAIAFRRIKQGQMSVIALPENSSCIGAEQQRPALSAW